MRGRKHFCLLIMLLFAFVMLPTPTIADYIPCSEVPVVGDPEGKVCFKGTEGDWTLVSVGYDGICGQDRNGNPTLCTKFDNYITGRPEGVFPDQANIRIDTCESGTGFLLVEPTDRSGKIRDCDPNSGMWCGDIYKSITLDSLKDDPSSQLDFNYAVTPATIQKTMIGLVTEIGDIFISGLGPGCCSTAINTSEVTYSLPNNGALWTFSWENSKGSMVATFSACSGDQTGVVYDPDAGRNYDLVDGKAYLCLGDTVGIFRNTCQPANKWGPRTGSFFYTEKYAYFGLGSQVWRGPEVYSHPPTNSDPTCTVTATVPFPSRRTYGAGLYQINQDQCGNLISVIIQNQTLYPSDDQFWLCETNARGNLDVATCGIILVANQDDAVIHSNPCWIISGGRRVYCATCTCR